jgi:hypothetical protein
MGRGTGTMTPDPYPHPHGTRTRDPCGLPVPVQFPIYVRKVSGDPYRWRLKEFFTELFNYCFPINFRMKQREKLNRCYQNDKTVREYIYELSELWNTIGDVDERQKVSFLWTGLTASIQTELWKKELNPESSSFREVRNAAEIIEIAHSIPQNSRNRRTQARQSQTAQPSGKSNNGSNQHQNDSKLSLGNGGRSQVSGNEHRRGGFSRRQEDRLRAESASNGSRNNRPQRRDNGHARNSPFEKKTEMLS